MEHSLGLTDLYNLLEDGAFSDVARTQSHLDDAVSEAYGWPGSLVDDDWNARLLDLNRRIAAGYVDYGGPRPEGAA